MSPDGHVTSWIGDLRRRRYDSAVCTLSMTDAVSTKLPAGTRRKSQNAEKGPLQFTGCDATSRVSEVPVPLSMSFKGRRLQSVLDSEPVRRYKE